MPCRKPGLAVIEENVLTTFSSYGGVAGHRQAEKQFVKAG
jgi:hypothetical protein